MFMGTSRLIRGCAAEKVNIDGRSMTGEWLSSFRVCGGADSVRGAVMSEFEWSRMSNPS
jgi:hypothetical protein